MSKPNTPTAAGELILAAAMAVIWTLLLLAILGREPWRPIW